jgi:hypothetical protein
MTKLLAFAIGAIAFTVSVVTDAAPVTWSFYETSCPSCTGAVHYPNLIASLTAPGPTSFGDWHYTTFPVSTGDPFTFTLYTESAGAISVHDDLGGGNNKDPIVFYDISWSEVAGTLTSVSVNFLADFDEAILSFSQGTIGSDYMLGGCVFSQCQITGVWQSDLAVPEPTSGVLLITGLLGAFLASRSRLSA